MPIHHAIWKVGSKPEPLLESVLSTEKLLEDMIVTSPEILSKEWMLIGRQEDTGFGGRIDLLAIAPDGALVLIELKRDRTPREVVAQSIDYACWVDRLKSEDISAIYKRFAAGKDLAVEFKKRFGQALDEETLNQSHQIIIVAASLDASTERIVSYLSQRDIPINVLCFQVFSSGSDQLISRSWLLDPGQTQVSAATSQTGENIPWNGEFYVSFGQNEDRSWVEAVKYGFVSGGGGTWYSRTLQLLQPGDRVWVNIPGHGYTGVGRVKGVATPAREFHVLENGVERRLLDVTTTTYLRKFIDDDENCEYFVPVEWVETRLMEQAIAEVGFFGNQNTVCRPRKSKWTHTVERLKHFFQSVNDS